MTYDDDDYNDVNTGQGCLIAVFGGLICWAILIATCIAIFGCGPSTTKINAMTGVELVSAHQHELNYWGKADMDIVRALRARDGITDADVRYYEDGGRWSHPTMFSCWGYFDETVGFDYDWESLGYASLQDWHSEMTGRASLGGTNVYTGHGVVNVRRSGNSISVRRIGR